MVDDGYSGKNLNGPMMQEILQMVEDDLIDAVSVFRLDRLMRSVADPHWFIEVLDEHDVQLVGVS